MGFSYIRSKFAVFDDYRGFYTSKIVPRQSLPQGTDFGLSSCCRSRVIRGGNFIRLSMLSAMSLFALRHIRTHVGNRFYSYPIRLPWLRWLGNRRNWYMAIFVGSCAFATYYLGNLEMIPYSKRTHFVPVSDFIEKQLGESEIKKLKMDLKGTILPETHPVSVKVSSISREITRALQRGLRLEESCGNVKYASESDEEILDIGNSIVGEKGLKLRQERVERTGRGLATQHLNGINWEVMVVDKPLVDAFCLPGGKIVIYKGLLDRLKSDAEIATIIGHEVGHAVARHVSERLMRSFWSIILRVVLHEFSPMNNIITRFSYFKERFLVEYPHCRRMEAEADYIGLMLMASAGYDPREAPEVFERIWPSGFGYLSSHPSGSKRTRLLKDPKVLDEALSAYREAAISTEF